MEQAEGEGEKKQERAPKPGEENFQARGGTVKGEALAMKGQPWAPRVLTSEVRGGKQKLDPNGLCRDQLDI